MLGVFSYRARPFSATSRRRLHPREDFELTASVRWLHWHTALPLFRILALSFLCWLSADLVMPTVGGAFSFGQPRVFIDRTVGRERSQPPPAQILLAFPPHQPAAAPLRRDPRMATEAEPGAGIEPAFPRSGIVHSRDTTSAPVASDDH
jgi:hypothetical protein